MNRHPKRARNRTARGNQFGRINAPLRSLEPLESRNLLAADPGFSSLLANPWHNSIRPTDVNRDGIVSPLDALRVINAMSSAGGPYAVNANGSGLTRSMDTISNSTSSNDDSNTVSPQNLVDVNGDGLVSPMDALIVINALNDPPVATVRLVTADLSGDPISTITPGSNFQLQAYVQDVSPSSSTGGVFAAYVNSSFSSTLASVVSNTTVTFGPTYTNVQSGNLSNPGFLSDVGATASSLSPLGPTERLLWSVQIHANSSGTATFAPTLSSVAGHEFLLYGVDHAIPASQVDLQGAVLQITGPAFTVNDIDVPQVFTGPTNAVFTVTLSTALGQPATVQYSTADGTATSPADYLPTSGTLTFAPGVTTQPVTVTVNTAAAPHPSTNFLLNLSNAQGAATIADDQGIATLTAIGLSINDVSQVEGTLGTSNFVFTVTLSSALSVPTTVGFATADQSAIAGIDYQPQSGNLTFQPGQLAANITVPVIGNTALEPNKTFLVNISSSSSGVGVSRGTGVGTILNDDLGGFSIGDITVLQPTSGTTNAIFTVTLAGGSNSQTTVVYSTADGSATTANGEYVPTSGTLTFAPGVVSRQITVVVNGDPIADPDENFFVNLTNPSGATIADEQAIATVHSLAGPQDIVAQIRLEVTDTAGNQISTLNIGDDFLLRAFVSDVRPVPSGVFEAYMNVTYAAAIATVNGDIIFGPNYPNGHSADVSIGGQISGIGAFDDSTPLGAGERLLFSAPMEATASGILQFLAFPDQTVGHEVLLYNQDTPIPISQVRYVDSQSIDVGSNAFLVNNISQNEGNAGSTPFVFTITRFKPESTTATVVYTTANGTATSPQDYTPTSGTLTFAPGVTTQLITVNVTGDTLDEPDKTFFVNLSSPTNAAIGSGHGIGTILDDDAAPTATISNATGDEGSTIVFNVQLSTVSGQTVMIAYATGDSPSGNKAIAGTDYLPANGTITFAPGVTQQNITVNALTDDLVENDETFRVNLSNPSNVTLGNSSATGTIRDVKPARITGIVYVDANGNGVRDTNEVGIGGATLTATNVATGAVKTTFSLGNGSYSFAGLQPGTYNIVETQPGFFLNGTPSSNRYDNVVLAPAGLSSGYDFGEGGLRPEFVAAFMNRRAFLSSSVGQPLELPMSTEDMDLRNGDVWVSFDGGWQNTRKFEALFQSSQGAVTLSLYDNNLKLLGTSTSATDTAVLFGRGTLGSAYFLKISGTNSNATLQVTESATIANTSVIEGNDGLTNLVFDVVLSAPSSDPITVAFATANASGSAGATANLDYKPTSGTLTFIAGSALQKITVPVIADTTNEVNETLLVNLSAPSGAFVDTAQATGTIINDDAPPIITINNVEVDEPASGSINAIFTVSLSSASSTPITVVYGTANGTATSRDYSAANGTLTFAPGVLTQTITVKVKADPLNFADETFFVNLSNASGAIILNTKGTCTINLDSALAADLIMESEDDWWSAAA